KVLEGETIRLPFIWYYPKENSLNNPNSPVCLRSIIFPVFNGDGNISTIIMMHENVTEMMLSQLMIKESEQRYRLAVQHYPGAFMLLDPEGRLLFVNDYTLKLQDSELKDFIGKKLEDILPPYSLYITPLFDLALKTKEIQSNELTYSLKGSQRSIILTFIPVFDDDKNVKQVLGITQNITDRINAEEKLRESEQRYRALVENLPDLVLVHIEGRIVFVNDAAVKFINKPEHELIGTTIFDYTDENSKQLIANYAAKRLSGETIAPYEIDIVSGHNFKRRVIVKAENITFNNETASLVVLTDITERLKTEKRQALTYHITESANNAENLDNLFKIIHTAISELMPADNLYIALYDRDIDLITFPYFVDQYDEKPESRRPGKSITEYVLRKGEALLATPEVYEKLVADGEIDGLGEPSIDWLGVPLRVKDCVIGILVVQSYTEGVRYGKEELDVLSFVSHQIAMAIERKRVEDDVIRLNAELEKRVIERTVQLEDTLEELMYENEERKRTEIELYKMKDELAKSLEKERELNEMKTKFVSMVSHEYRTPLTVIMTSIELIELQFRKYSDKETSKYVVNIKNAIKTMTALLNNVLTIGRLDSDKSANEPEPINLIKTIHTLLFEQKIIDSGRHKFVFNHNVEEAELKADENILRQIFGNLITNAMKYSPLGTEISIDLVSDGEIILVDIIDSGIGIPEEDQKFLFEPFHRGNNVGAISGTGLGLSIVKKCCDTLDARITVNSQVGSGSTFTVIINTNRTYILES
ncbi:MAG: hypothetical protein QG635_1955, partial [Bacteroidota bacterium]|nr:hypothetical protein [Bacteroidota bacterium]